MTLAVLNVLAFALSVGAILWAWVAVRRDIASNSKVLTELRNIDAKYEQMPGGEPTDRETQAAKFRDYRQAGKFIFTYNDMQHMPEVVKTMIFQHSVGGLRSQVVLVGLGLALGTVANVWSLYI